MPEEEHICFHDPNFLASFPLTHDNILQYFSTSQFYDSTCINEILKMQSQFAGIDIGHKLTTTPGVYYQVVDNMDSNMDNSLFIIAKKKFDGTNTTTLKLYYCIHGYIYAAPTTKLISEARMTDALWYLSEALNHYEDQKKFNWLEGFKYKKEDKAENDDVEEVKFMLEALHDFEKGMKH